MLHAREAGDFVELLLLYDTIKSHLPPALNLEKYSYKDFLLSVHSFMSSFGFYCIHL